MTAGIKQARVVGGMVAVLVTPLAAMDLADGLEAIIAHVDLDDVDVRDFLWDIAKLRTAAADAAGKAGQAGGPVDVPFLAGTAVVRQLRVVGGAR